MADEADMVKVRFELEKEEDGWPPAASEGVWAEKVGDDLYRIDNIPWFAWVVAADDVVRAEPDDDGVLWVRETVRHSGNCTIRVLPFRDGPLHGDAGAVLDLFVALGTEGEGAGPTHNLIALNVPASADLAVIKSRLWSGEVNGSWAFEEACVTEAWRNA